MQGIYTLSGFQILSAPFVKENLTEVSDLSGSPREARRLDRVVPDKSFQLAEAPPVEKKKLRQGLVLPDGLPVTDCAQNLLL